ncbi:hypothetical protein D3C72_2262980 [compost metagenome]
MEGAKKTPAVPNNKAESAFTENVLLAALRFFFMERIFSNIYTEQNADQAIACVHDSPSSPNLRADTPDSTHGKPCNNISQKQDIACS